MRSEPHIPTLVAILILFIGVSATIFLVENSTKLFSQAAENSKPQSVSVSSVTETSFTITWTTQIPTRGSIKYKEHSLLSNAVPAFDVRDQPPELTPRYTHFVKVEGSTIKPNTSYDITIISGATEYEQSHLLVKTGNLLSSPAYLLDPAFGQLIDNRNQPVTDALVFASFDGSQMLSTVVGANGEWTIPLGVVRNTQYSRYFTPGNSDQERLFFVSHDGESTVVTTINNDSPLPPVRLGENYDFTKTTRRRFTPVITQSNSNNGTFQVLLPQNEAFIPSGKPAFKGIGVPQKQVIMTISGGVKPIVANLQVAPNGTWSWTPETSLVAGKYVATITSFNSNNKPATTSLAFSVFKSGTQVLGDATASASISPSPRTSSIPSPSAKASSKPSPALKPSPSASPGTQPVTGVGGPTIGFLAIGVLLLIFGSVSFLTRKDTY